VGYTSPQRRLKVHLPTGRGIACAKCGQHYDAKLVDARQESMKKELCDFDNDQRDPEVVGLFPHSGYGAQVE